MILNGEKFEINIRGGNGMFVVDMQFPRSRRFRAVMIDDVVRLESVLTDAEEAAMGTFVMSLLRGVHESVEDFDGVLELITNAQFEVLTGQVSVN